MRARATGTIVTLPDKEPTGFYADEAKAIQKQRQERSRARAEARANTPIPNYLCYRELFAGFDPKTHRYADGRSRRVPKCRVCECNLYPMEHHVCEGFKPKFVEHDEAWRERWEARREMIREAKRNGTFFSEDEDDLSGYEDEPEEDWCDEDDGDPMWE